MDALSALERQRRPRTGSGTDLSRCGDQAAKVRLDYEEFNASDVFFLFSWDSESSVLEDGECQIMRRPAHSRIFLSRLFLNKRSVMPLN